MQVLSKSTRIIPDVAAQRKVESTVSHIARAWLPVNPVVFEQIQQKFLVGEYAENKAQLAEDICADLSLLTHSIRFLRTRLEEPVPSLQPLRDLVRLDDESLKKLLLAPLPALSRHKLSGSNRLKNDILKTTFVAANAAHTIALQGASAGLDVQPANALCCTMLRQLGWNLVAWNYPSVLAGVLRSTRNNSVEAARSLRKVLGVSPEDLGARYAKEWLLAPDLRDVLQPLDRFRTPAGEIPRSHIEILRAACELGESFSRTQAPERFPNAEKEWEKKSATLGQIAPKLTYESLKSVVQETTEVQLEQLQRATAKVRAPKAAQRTETVKAQPVETPRSFSSNAYLQKCPEYIQDQFRLVYDSIKQTGPCIEALQSLVTNAIPASGFSSGIIYLLDSKRFDLVTAAKIGSSARTSHPQVKSILDASAHEALTSDLPVRREDISDDGFHFEHVSAAFGDETKPGVLVLEIAGEAAGDPEHDTTLYFKAIRHCLHDCLALKH